MRNETAPSGGEGGTHSSPPFYVDDYLIIRVQQSYDDTIALTASASVAYDDLRLFGPGKTGVMPILAPKNSKNLDSTVDALGLPSTRTP